MSLLDDYEKLCDAQDIGIFKDTLDETLKPILIILDERYFKVNRMVDDLHVKISNLRNDVENSIKGLEVKFNNELNDAYDTHNTKLHNIWTDILKLESDMETIKLNLNLKK